MPPRAAAQLPRASFPHHCATWHLPTASATVTLASHIRSDHGIRLGAGSLCLSPAKSRSRLPSVQTRSLVVTRSSVSPHLLETSCPLKAEAGRQDGAYDSLSWTCASSQPRKAENEWHRELSKSPNTCTPARVPLPRQVRRGEHPLSPWGPGSICRARPLQPQLRVHKRFPSEAVTDPPQWDWEAPSNLRVNDRRDLNVCSLLAYREGCCLSCLAGHLVPLQPQMCCQTLLLHGDAPS